MQSTASPTYSDLLQEVQRFWSPLPDKPEETPEGLLAALWNTACGTPLSVDRALGAPLAALDEASHARLRELLERRKSGVPLAHLTERQMFMGLAERVEMRVGDLLEPFEDATFLGKCDFLSCNPPYISTAKVKDMHPEISRHEPQAAFNGGAFGVSILMKLLKTAPRFLRPGAWLGFEVGHGQGPGLARQLERSPAFAAVETYADSGGEIRAILAKCKPVLG